MTCLSSRLDEALYGMVDPGIQSALGADFAVQDAADPWVIRVPNWAVIDAVRDLIGDDLIGDDDAPLSRSDLLRDTVNPCAMGVLLSGGAKMADQVWFIDTIRSAVDDEVFLAVGDLLNLGDNWVGELP